VAQTSSPKVNVSTIGSSAGSLYERLRNVIDYKDEHLLRRNAIERILKRKLLFPNGDSIGEGLIKELIWGQYIKNDSIPYSMASVIDVVVEKYKRLFGFKQENVKEDEGKKWLIGLMSVEVDRLLVSQILEEALNRAMYRWIESKIRFPSEVNDKEKQVQTFIAVRKSLFKEDIPTVRYNLLLTYIPSWGKADIKLTEKFSENFSKIYQEIEGSLKNPLNTKLTKFFQPFTPPFLIVRDLILKFDLVKLLEDPDELDYQIERTCEKKYLLTRNKLGRSIFRSTVYIFLTKMLLAYVLEMPADLYLYNKVHLTPLAINIIFPPVLMYMIGSSIKAPRKENTEIIKKLINEICYESSKNQTEVPGIYEARNVFLGRLFWVLYVIGFVLSYGFIVYILNRLHFGLASGALFLFFLSVVSFFAYRIRLTAREYMVIGQREGIISGIIDFFIIPFLRMGQWLSIEFSKINIFMFVFDFIIEAPFKAFIEIAEEWIGFLRQKKEEII